MGGSRSRSSLLESENSESLSLPSTPTNSEESDTDYQFNHGRVAREGHHLPPPGTRKYIKVKRRLKRFNAGSTFDDSKSVFGEKRYSTSGDEADFEHHGIYITCRKGNKSNFPNQDSWYIKRSEDFSMYGVFDGHGPKGHHISNFVKNRLPNMIISNERFRTSAAATKEVLESSFEQMTLLVAAATNDKTIDAKRSGTTATIAVHDHVTRMLTTSHVGDSGAMVASGKRSKAKYLTPDHKPDAPKEKARIEKCGGNIWQDQHRTYRLGSLNMSRAFGDLAERPLGVISTPDVRQIKLNDTHRFILLCTDGVWEHVEPQQAADMISAALARRSNPINPLISEATNRAAGNTEGYVDDTTALLIVLKQDNTAEPKLQRQSSFKKSSSIISGLSGTSSMTSLMTPASTSTSKYDTHSFTSESSQSRPSGIGSGAGISPSQSEIFEQSYAEAPESRNSSPRRSYAEAPESRDSSPSRSTVASLSTWGTPPEGRRPCISLSVQAHPSTSKRAR